jgi:proton glutamate symport protein
MADHPHHHESERAEIMHDVNETIIHEYLWLKILIGMGLGIGLGFLLSPSEGALIQTMETANTVGEWVALPGILFLSLLKMIVIPLIAVSIILGINSSRDLGFVKHISAVIIPYFVVTTAIAIGIGILLVQFLKPGAGFDQILLNDMLNSGAANDTLPDYNLADISIPDRLANLIPTNITQAGVEENMLQIVIASMIAGIAMITLPKHAAEPIIHLSKSIQMLCMKVIGWAMHIAPYAVFGLLCDLVIRTGFSTIETIGYYFVTVLLGLGAVLIVYMVIAVALGKRHIVDFLKGIREAQLIAFSTSSSAATMPISIQVAEENLHVKPAISRFIIPLGATINMDGTALYQAVAALFLCQVFGIDLSSHEVLILLLTTVGASIGTPGTPGVGIAVLATILTGIGVPPEGIALLLGVDRLLDMCRTTVNVTGDLTATTVMDRWIKMDKTKEVPA